VDAALGAVAAVRRAALALTLCLSLAACGSGHTSAAPAPAVSSPALSPPVLSSPPSPVLPSAAVPAPAVPAGVAASVVVFDRQTGEFVYSLAPSTSYRSASLVKLLIVLDVTWSARAVPVGDRDRLDVMLRSSDDAAATFFWRRGGQRALVTRMAQRLGLVDTDPPPADRPGFWGYTALSAADVVKIYRYLFEQAPAAVRDYVLGTLRASTRCGTDRYDQSFGIPTALARPWAVKQGWSGFGDTPATPCTATAALPLAALPDLSGEVLHTTGVVGAGDRALVAVLTTHPDGTPYARATAAVTDLVRSLRIPGTTPA
jgi:hypothetical protein